ncbi:STAS domain-containing protein [Terrilactibacillus sp. BCM23-1]|uniref:STAS domain-containing protein n=1 Tax=Terrilactibacillus tamarindi TaxID=2599694 RepID=A0A6N8CP64_9BACI|nr:SulP family inorganic anion transporter [Terrilactibacillus tamarindi]MTT31912.1 STAS domain-containing protein [Terrilactibacillus tamarindi]
MINHIKKEWFSNIRGDILAGIVVSLALIPEVTGFSIIAGVSPMVGLYASFCTAMILAFVGGRPGMISAAAGAMALVLVGLVKEHGIQYMLAATFLTGIIQFILGLLKVGRLVKFIPHAVMIGFVNALAILIFTSQFTSFSGESWIMYAMVAGGLIIIYVFPKITKVVPSALVAIIVITIVSVWLGSPVKTIGDMGKVSSMLPHFLIPHIPFNLETLLIILPYSASLAIVGLVETLLTAQLIDEETNTESQKNRECVGQGIGNMFNGLFGGTAGCAMIGQSVINLKSGGRGRLSTFVAGAFLFLLIMVLRDIVVQVPLAALVAVMFVVAISTFDWTSLKRLHKFPKTDVAVMVVTVIVVVITHNLAFGVITGIILSAIFFAAKISKINISKTIDEEKHTLFYKVEGQLFFASVTDFVASFDFNPSGIKGIVIDFTRAHIWDESGVAGVDKIVGKYKENHIDVKIKGLNHSSERLLDKASAN